MTIIYITKNALTEKGIRECDAIKTDFDSVGNLYIPTQSSHFSDVCPPEHQHKKLSAAKAKACEMRDEKIEELTDKITKLKDMIDFAPKSSE